MPLIVFCGIPGSGKSKRALEIKKYLEEEHKVPVVHITEDNMAMNKNEAYKDSTTEKMTRGFIKSNVEKNLDSRVVVIADSLNYIKGFRYEMFCLVRSAKTPHCIVFCDTPLDLAKQFNSQNKNQYEPALLEDLASRMERPNPKNRWDSPLFDLRPNEQTPLEEIADVLLFQEKKSRDPISTKAEAKLELNFVYESDKITQEIINQIMEKQNDMFIQGMTLSFEVCKQKLRLNRNVTFIELKKLRQEFVGITKANPPKSVNDIGDLFVAFLQGSIDRV